MDRWLSSDSGEIVFNRRQRSWESSSTRKQPRRVVIDRRQDYRGQDDPGQDDRRSWKDDLRLSGGVENEEDDDGHLRCHQGRVVHSGQGVVDVSAATAGQPRARGRSAKLLSVLTPAGGRGGATSRADVELMDDVWEQVPVMSSREAGGPATSHRSVASQLDSDESRTVVSILQTLSDAMYDLSKDVSELKEHQQS